MSEENKLPTTEAEVAAWIENRTQFYASLPQKGDPQNTGDKVENLFDRAADFASNSDMSPIVTLGPTDPKNPAS